MIPRMPPIKVSVAASTRNCQRTSRRVAPIALRKPISRVRLVTDTIMIAITPIPPTRSAILDSTSITKKNANVRLSKMPTTWSAASRSKLVGSPTRSPRERPSCSAPRSTPPGTLPSARGRGVGDPGVGGCRLGLRGGRGGGGGPLGRARAGCGGGGGKDPEEGERGGPADLARVEDLHREPRHDRRHGHDRSDPDDHAE